MKYSLPPSLWNCKEVVERYSAVCISKDAEGQVFPTPVPFCCRLDVVRREGKVGLGGLGKIGLTDLVLPFFFTEKQVTSVSGFPLVVQLPNCVLIL